MKRNRSIFAIRLRLARTGSGLTQADLAEVIKVSSGTVLGWEMGKQIPNVLVGAALARTLDVSLDWLAGRTDEIAPADESVMRLRSMRGGLRESLAAMTRAMEELDGAIEGGRR